MFIALPLANTDRSFRSDVFNHLDDFAPKGASVSK
jgi:hypothetical protein